MPNLSTDELIRAVQNDAHALPREIELLSRLVDTLDEVDELTRQLRAAEQEKK